MKLSSTSLFISFALTASASSKRAANSTSYATTLPAHAQELFDTSIEWMDGIYDPDYGYLYSSSSSAYRHETRSSAYYAVALLARNRGDDVQHAEKIFANIIGAQFKDPADQWYGTYQQYPEEPAVGTPYYEPEIYVTWDPNWRGFVGTAFIIGLEEFGDLMSAGTRALIAQSLYNNTKGDSYRVGGVDGDNLYPAYSNPSIMRAFVTGYTGRLFNDSNMTASAEDYASQIIELFERADTLSEFNSGTYTGVSVYALTLWATYSVDGSVMKKMGPRMLQATWQTVSQLYHAGLKNLAGPWDRGYGWDMQRYLSILALQMWTLVGREKAPLGRNIPVLSHVEDFTIGPLVAILAPYHNALINGTILSRLSGFPGEHLVATSAYSPPFDFTGAPRNITTWLAENITIGAESFIEDVVGGPAINPSQFNPAVIQWKIDAGIQSGVGVITLYATEPAIHAEVTPGVLRISYPSGNSSSTFQLLVAQMAARTDVGGWADLPNLSVEVGGNVDGNYTLSFNSDGINDFFYWNFTYAMPGNLTAPPSLEIRVETVY